AAGEPSANLTVNDDAPGSPHPVPLAGSAVAAPQAAFDPASLTFSSHTVSSASAAQVVTLSNPGSAPLAITSIGLSGANAGDFSQTNTCAAALAAGAKCSISVIFKPSAAGSRSATLTI